MKSHMIYTCEICGKTSIDKNTIKKCENSHIRVDEIHKVTYDVSDNKSKYPISIDVQMQDGKIIKYSRK